MIATMHFLTLVFTTVFAAAAAVLCNWLLMRAAFHLIRPLTARRKAAPLGSELVRGTGELARAFALHP